VWTSSIDASGSSGRRTSRRSRHARTIREYWRASNPVSSDDTELHSAKNVSKRWYWKFTDSSGETPIRKVVAIRRRFPSETSSLAAKS
jgi:hypothetical protein